MTVSLKFKKDESNWNVVSSGVYQGSPFSRILLSWSTIIVVPTHLLTLFRRWCLSCPHCDKAYKLAANVPIFAPMSNSLLTLAWHCIATGRPSHCFVDEGIYRDALATTSLMIRTKSCCAIYFQPPTYGSIRIRLACTYLYHAMLAVMI